MKKFLGLALLLAVSLATPAQNGSQQQERKWRFEMDLRYQHMMFWNSHYKYDEHLLDYGSGQFVTYKGSDSSHALFTDQGYDNGYGGNSLLLMETYRLSRRWTVGLGAGLSWDNQLSHNFVPLFALGRWHPWLQHRHAYLYAEAGFLGCPGLNVGYGVSLKIGKRQRLSLKVGYDLQASRTQTDYDDRVLDEHTWYKYDGTTLMHCLQGGIGLVF